jgi:2-dehydro-3-deoxyphosphooctonate aldolase (KDO 8-P synthase)
LTASSGVPRVEIAPGVACGGGGPLLVIAGTCVIESRESALDHARALAAIARDVGLPLVFKASFDKANRTSADSFRGPGLARGLEILEEVRGETGLPLLSDVHEPGQCAPAGRVLDVLQIPAFLCRQTDLLLAAAATGRVVNVKKGQFLAPWDVKNIGKKLERFGCEQFFFTERGVTFGYNNLVADMRSLYWIREEGYFVMFDATHSVQRPGGAGDKTSGDGILAPVLARAAVAAGCDGVFIETHENPAEAFSDGPNQIPLAELPNLLKKLMAIHELVR